MRASLHKVLCKCPLIEFCVDGPWKYLLLDNLPQNGRGHGYVTLSWQAYEALFAHSLLSYVCCSAVFITRQMTICLMPSVECSP